MSSWSWRLGVALSFVALGSFATVAGVLSQRADRFPATLFGAGASPGEPTGAGGGATGGTEPRPSTRAADRTIFGSAIRGHMPVPNGGAGVVKATPMAQAGPTLLVSADAAEVRLIDDVGAIIHSWHKAFDDVRSWSGDSHWGPDWPPQHQGRSFFRDARLLADGSILALFEGLGLVRLDAQSRVAWASRVGQKHDSFDVADNGVIYALSRRVVTRKLRLVSFRPPGDRIVETEVVVLQDDGREVERFSLLDALLDSDHATLLEWGKYADALGATCIRLAKHGSYRGQMVVCFRNLGSIAIVDPASRRVTAVFAGLVDLPSFATPLQSGRILAFGNTSLAGHATAVEFEPRTQRIVWRYPMPGEPPLRSEQFGMCQRLPNDNTLITESFSGRAIEVTSSGQIAWEYRTPYRHGERVATLFRAERIDARALRFTPRGSNGGGQ